MVIVKPDPSTPKLNGVVLFSGGLKSTVLLDVAGLNCKQISALMLRSKYNDDEQAKAANAVVKHHYQQKHAIALCMLEANNLKFEGIGTLDYWRGGDLKDRFGFYYEAIVQATIVAFHMKCSVIYLGINDIDQSGIEQTTALHNIVRTMSNDTITLIMPFFGQTDEHIVTTAQAFKSPYGQSRSCELNNEVVCGKCSGCMRRIDALVVNQARRNKLKTREPFIPEYTAPQQYEGL